MTAQERDEGSLLAPGDLVSGEYVVDAVARRGPGWIWYRGHHVERTDELVMITSLRADAPSAGYIEAFAKRSQWLAEARIPNVPPLLASGVEMGLPFIVTPWVDGMTLRELLDAEGSLSRDEALRIIKAIGVTFDALHARRPVVVHQLLSLDNIRIDAITRAARLMDAGVAHALRLARVDDVHAAAKVDGVFRAPEDTVGRTPSPAIDRYALAKLAEVLLSPIPPGSTLARVISRGSSDLSASRFSTCAAFVQSLALALKEALPADGAHVARPLPAPHPPSDGATHSPAASAVGAASKSPSGSALGAATKSPAASALGAATRSPAVPPLSTATKSSDPALRAVAIPPLGKVSEPPMPAVHAPTKSSDPAIPAAHGAPPLPAAHGAPPLPAAHAPVAPSATHSPTASALGAAHKPPTPPLPTAPRPAAPPPLRTPKSTLMGMAPPALPSKPMASTLMGIAPPSVDAPLPNTPAAIAVAPAPAEIAASVGVAPKSASEEERFPFAPEPTKTERVEIDPSMRDSSLDEELSVGDQSIMEVVSGDILLDKKETPALIVESAPAPTAPAAHVEPPKIEAPEFELSIQSEEEEEDKPAVALAPIAPAPVDPSSTPVPVAVASTVRDIGLAKTLLSSGPVEMRPMLAATGRVPEPSAEFDDPFPAIPPLDPTEKERQAQQQGMDVPPLFEAAPPVPAPISPDATSGVAPVSVEKARRSRNIAIAVGAVLGLGGGLGGGLFAFDRMMRGQDSTGIRSVVLVADSGTVAITEPVQSPPVVEDAAALAQNATDDATVAVNAGDDRDASALVAQTEDASTSTGVEDASSAVANNAVEDSGVPDPTNSTNTASNTQPSAPEDSGVAAQPVVPDGVTVVAGASGLSSPNWRIRAGARRLVKERVEGCGQGSVRGTARFEVRFDGATGRVIEFNLSGARFRNTPVGACIESAMRSVALPPFTQRYWDTDYAVPLR
jgi:serine/threonine protein kinase